MNFAVVCISDRCSKGLCEDKSGPLISELISSCGKTQEYIIVPDEKAEIEKALIYLCDEVKADIVFTTGGTGFAPRDVTPEATMAVIERNAPGIAEAIRMKSMEITPKAVFFVSMEDDLMRMFGSDRLAGLMDRMGFQEGEMIEHKMISDSIERAQKKVEENNFGIRKRLIEYDDVMNQQRNVIYAKRHHALMGERIGVDITNMIYDTAASVVADAREVMDYRRCHTVCCVNTGNTGNGHHKCQTHGKNLLHGFHRLSGSFHNKIDNCYYVRTGNEKCQGRSLAW